MRIKASLPWYFIVPVLLIVTESCLRYSSDFMRFHLSIAFQKQPGWFSWHAAKLIVRVALAYGVLAIGLEFLFRLLRFRNLASPWVRSSLYFLICSVLIRQIFVLQPAVSSLYVVYYPKYLFFASLGLLLISLLRFRNTSFEPTKQSGTTLGLTFVGMLLALGLSAPSGWKQNEQSTNKRLVDSETPSILLISFDGIPNAVFTQPGIAPNWESRWKEKNYAFENTYAVTNSTFTSWFSILSGQHPLSTGVESLYPYQREGRTNLATLLPRRLQQRGYQTAFMTDCAATSFMKPEYGFDKLYQLDEGVFECGRSLLSSAHPLTYLFTMISDTLFPELNTFCSGTYRPERFFSQVKTTLADLDKSQKPYFLAIHSCISHQQLLHHVPPMHSRLRENLSKSDTLFSQKLHNLKLSLRWVDHYLNDLLLFSENLSQESWKLFFSDHGSRIDLENGKWTHFTHGVGYPVNRFQYHVPLYLIPPKFEAKGQSFHKLTTLLDIYPTVLSLAGSTVGQSEGVSLFAHVHNKAPVNRSTVLSSSIPLPFQEGKSSRLIQLFLSNGVNSKGHHAFDEKEERALLQNRPLALLQLPYRLLSKNGNILSLYNELEDPHHLRDLSKQMPNMANKLNILLCEKIDCPLSLPRKNGSEPIQSTKQNHNSTS